MVSAEFEKAAKEVTELPKQPNSTEMLKTYALYKQATVGDCNADEPSVFNMTAKAKWKAWNAEKGKASAEAEAEYIAHVEELKLKYQ